MQMEVMRCSSITIAERFRLQWRRLFHFQSDINQNPVNINSNQLDHIHYVLAQRWRHALSQEEMKRIDALSSNPEVWNQFMELDHIEERFLGSEVTSLTQSKPDPIFPNQNNKNASTPLAGWISSSSSVSKQQTNYNFANTNWSGSPAAVATHSNANSPPSPFIQSDVSLSIKVKQEFLFQYIESGDLYMDAPQETTIGHDEFSEKVSNLLFGEEADILQPGWESFLSADIAAPMNKDEAKHAGQVPQQPGAQLSFFPEYLLLDELGPVWQSHLDEILGLSCESLPLVHVPNSNVKVSAAISEIPTVKSEPVRTKQENTNIPMTAPPAPSSFGSRSTQKPAPKISIVPVGAENGPLHSSSAAVHPGAPLTPGTRSRGRLAKNQNASLSPLPTPSVKSSKAENGRQEMEVEMESRASGATASASASTSAAIAVAAANKDKIEMDGETHLVLKRSRSRAVNSSGAQENGNHVATAKSANSELSTDHVDKEVSRMASTDQSPATTIRGGRAASARRKQPLAVSPTLSKLGKSSVENAASDSFVDRAGQIVDEIRSTLPKRHTKKSKAFDDMLAGICQRLNPEAGDHSKRYHGASEFAEELRESIQDPKLANRRKFQSLLEGFVEEYVQDDGHMKLPREAAIENGVESSLVEGRKSQGGEQDDNESTSAAPKPTTVLRKRLSKDFDAMDSNDTAPRGGDGGDGVDGSTMNGPEIAPIGTEQKAAKTVGLKIFTNQTADRHRQSKYVSIDAIATSKRKSVDLPSAQMSTVIGKLHIESQLRDALEKLRISTFTYANQPSKKTAAPSRGMPLSDLSSTIVSTPMSDVFSEQGRHLVDFLYSIADPSIANLALRCVSLLGSNRCQALIHHVAKDSKRDLNNLYKAWAYQLQPSVISRQMLSKCVSFAEYRTLSPWLLPEPSYPGVTQLAKQDFPYGRDLAKCMLSEAGACLVDYSFEQFTFLSGYKSQLHDNCRVLSDIYFLRNEYLRIPLILQHHENMRTIEDENHASDGWSALSRDMDEEYEPYFIPSTSTEDPLIRAYTAKQNVVSKVIGPAREACLAHGAVSLIFFHAGVQSVQSSCMDILAEVMADYITTIGKALCLQRESRSQRMAMSGTTARHSVPKSLVPNQVPKAGMAQDGNSSFELAKKVFISAGLRGSLRDLGTYKDGEVMQFGVELSVARTRLKEKVEKQKQVFAERLAEANHENAMSQVTLEADESPTMESDIFEHPESLDLVPSFSSLGVTKHGNAVVEILPCLSELHGDATFLIDLACILMTAEEEQEHKETMIKSNAEATAPTSKENHIIEMDLDP